MQKIAFTKGNVVDFQFPEGISLLPASANEIPSYNLKEDTAALGRIGRRRHRLIIEKKILTAMKLTALILFVCCMHVSAKTSSQNLNFKGTNITLNEVLDIIKEQTGYAVFGNMHMLKDAKRIDIDAKEMPLDKFLALALKKQSIRYRILDNTIILYKKEDFNDSNNIEIKASESFNQEAIVIVADPVKGRITGEDGTPLSGVTISVKGTKIATTSDDNGNYSIQVNEKQTLVFSYIGMATQEVRVNDIKKSINVVLKTTESEMDDVIITGYSNIKRESFTGNSIQVSKDQLLKVSNRNIIEALQVFDPSFRLEKNNLMGSDPNTMPDFYIRGRSGIGVKALDNIDVSEAALTNNPNLPIFIMDGYQVDAQRVYDYDMTRIKSITILKDAASTAIYGSRAANGVIVIETEPPVPGKLRINYNLVGQLTAPDLSSYNLMNATEKLEAERLAGFYESPIPATFQSLQGEYIKKENQLKRGINTDWIAQPITNMFNQKHTLSFDGGTDELRFSLTGRYDNQNGVMKKSLRDRMGVGLIVEYRIGKLQIRNDVSYDAVKAVNSPYGDFTDYTWKAPYDEMVGKDGKYIKNTTVWHSGGTDQLNIVNPLYEVFNTKNFSKSTTTTLINHTALNFRILPTLTIRGNFAITRQYGESNNFIDPNSGRYSVNVNTDYTDIGQLTKSNTKSTSIRTKLFANYINSIQDHTINFSIGVDTDESQSNGNTQIYKGFASGNQSSASYASKMSTFPSFSDNHTRGFGSFLALNYSFQEIYLMDISARLDGSSEFGTEKKYAPFWSFGLGINLHRYEFFDAITWINRARITGTLGQTGKTNFPPYAAKDSYKLNTLWYRTGIGASLIGMGNDFLTWEKTNNYDAILDLAFLNDLVTLNVNWYNKITNDLVNDVDLPLSAGFSSYKDNIGKIQNKGIEIATRVNIVRSKDIIFAVYGNFASNKNTLLDISYSLENYNKRVDLQYADYNASTGANPTNAKRYTTAHTKYVQGGSTTSLFGMKSLGINPLNGKEVFLNKDGTITYDWKASEQVIIGNTEAKGQGSFGINLTYKQFSLFTSALYQYGAQEYNYTLLSKVENVDLYNRNTDRRVLTERWRNPGDITMLKDIKDSKLSTLPTSRFIQDYNAITINSLSLGYEIDPKFLTNYKISRLRIQASTNNLATISTVKQERGLSYPFARTFDISVNVGF